MALPALAVRLFGVLVVAAVWRRAVGVWWWMAAASISLVLAAALSTGWSWPQGAATDLAWALLGELALGLVLGAFAALPGFALLGAADVSGQALFGRPDRVLTLVVVTAVLAAALSLHLHRPAIEALVAVSRAPVGELLAGDPLTTLVDAARHMTLLGLSLATPVLLVFALLEAAGWVLARVSLGAPVATPPVVLRWAQVALGLVCLGAALSTFPEGFARALL